MVEPHNKKNGVIRVKIRARTETEEVPWEKLNLAFDDRWESSDDPDERGSGDSGDGVGDDKVEFMHPRHTPRIVRQPEGV